MSFEDLITLQEAQKVIERIAASVGTNIDGLNETYKETYKKLGEIIERWECNLDIPMIKMEQQFNELTEKYGYTKGSLIYLGMNENEVAAMSDEDAEGSFEALPYYL